MRSFRAHFDENRLASTGKRLRDIILQHYDNSGFFGKSVWRRGLVPKNQRCMRSICTRRALWNWMIVIGKRSTTQILKLQRKTKIKLRFRKRSRWEPLLLQHDQLAAQSRQNGRGITRQQYGHFKFVLTKIKWHPLDKAVRTRYYYIRVILVSLESLHGERPLRSCTDHVFNQLVRSFRPAVCKWKIYIALLRTSQIIKIQRKAKNILRFRKQSRWELLLLQYEVLAAQ